MIKFCNTMFYKYNAKINDLIIINKELSRIKKSIFNYCIFFKLIIFYILFYKYIFLCFHKKLV